MARRIAASSNESPVACIHTVSGNRARGWPSSPDSVVFDATARHGATTASRASMMHGIHQAREA
jgi:hypothetical protein